MRQAHELWHRAVGAYHDPDEFVLNLNQLLITLRQVTFMLQNEKSKIADFDAWYVRWQTAMSGDPLMTWLRDARNFVEKRGDLEVASTARLTLIAGWIDGPQREFEVDPLLGPEEMAATFPVDELPDEVRKDALLQVERRWISRDLPTHELTDVCAHGYGVLATIVSEAHERLGYRMRTFGGETHEGRHHRIAHQGGRLPCMLLPREARIAHIHLPSGQLVSLDSESVSFERSKYEAAFVARSESMAIDPRALAMDPDADPLDWGAAWSSVARRTLAHDGYHRMLAALLGEKGQRLGMIGLNFDDQAEKYLAMRGLADEVERVGAQTVIVIGEAWEAQIRGEEFSPTMPRAGERPDRTEVLLVTVATSDGRHRTYRSPFTRDTRGQPILCSEVIEDDSNELPASLAPVQAVWRAWRARERSTRPPAGTPRA